MLSDLVALEGDTRVVMYEPHRVDPLIVTDMLSYKAMPRLYDQGTFEIVIDNYSPAWTKTHGGVSAYDDRWLCRSYDFWFRGVKKFSGPVVAGVIEEKEGGFGTRPLATARLTCCSWMTWFLGGRTFETESGTMWANTGHFDDTMREIVRQQCCSGALEPTNYPVGPDRANYGPWTLTCEADAGASSEEAYEVQAGKSVLDSVMELCTVPDGQAYWLWPYVEETTTPATFIFKVKVGRSGVGRAIGSDKTGTMIFAGYQGTAGPAKESFNHLNLMSVACTGGAGRGAARLRTFSYEPTLYGKIGTREDQVTIPGNTVAAERQQECRRMLNESNEDNTRTLEVEVIEKPGLRYGTNFNEMDDVTFASAATGSVWQKMVIGADIEAVSPDPATVKALVGTLPRQPLRDVGRSGGGGKGGGRRGGGKPKDSDGRSAVDPDLIHGYAFIQGTTGTAEAESYGHYLRIDGGDVASYLRITTAATDNDNSGDPGSPDTLLATIEGDMQMADPVMDGYVYIRKAGGGHIGLVANSAPPPLPP